MQAVRRPSRAEQAASQPGGASAAKYSSPYRADDLGLSFYTTAPSVEVSIREFEEITCGRLKLLHTFDRLCGYQISLAQVSDAIGSKIKPELQKSDINLSLAYPSGPAQEAVYPSVRADFLRRDALSHFILRLAFCKTRESREWFVRQEQRLFVIRFEDLNPEAREKFLVTSGIECTRFKGTEEELKELQNTTSGAKIWGDAQSGSRKFDMDRVFYELPFNVLQPGLIASRRVVLRKGKAFIPSSALKLILANRFKEQLAVAMDVALNGLPTALADPRVGGFIRLIQEQGMQLLLTPKASSEDIGEALSFANFEDIFERSFPPCMRRLVEKTREQKKRLKHAGKMQLRPFLKACGFSLEESLRWWKQEFCRDPEVDAVIFDKDYTYDIEHTYGRKGHLQGQNAFGCPKIINFPPEAAGQCHGCPFKSLDGNALKQQLFQWRIPEANANEIFQLVKNGNHYQLACIEYFKGRHPGHEGDGVGNNPKDFFNESCRFYTSKKDKEAADSPAKSPAKAAVAGK